jgi:hypothetical protein
VSEFISGYGPLHRVPVNYLSDVFRIETPWLVTFWYDDQYPRGSAVECHRQAGEITGMLASWSVGNRGVLDRLLRSIRTGLHRSARRHPAQEPPTVLVNWPALLKKGAPAP